jgi:hypothetical protein
MTDSNNVFLIDYFDFLAPRRVPMKTYNIQVLVSIAEANDKEMDTAIPVVVTIPVNAANRDEAQSLFAQTFSKMMDDTRKLRLEEHARQMKEIADLARKSVAESGDTYRDKRYRWEKQQSPYKVMKDRGTYTLDEGSSSSNPYDNEYGKDSYGHSYGGDSSVSDPSKKGGYGPNHF